MLREDDSAATNLQSNAPASRLLSVKVILGVVGCSPLSPTADGSHKMYSIEADGEKVWIYALNLVKRKNTFFHLQAYQYVISYTTRSAIFRYFCLLEKSCGVCREIKVQLKSFAQDR